MDNKMTVELWGDILCPFCYFTTIRFERALDAFENKENIEVVFRSFQLRPNARYEPGKSAIQSDSEYKNVPIEEITKNARHLEKRGLDLGLNINFDNAKVTDTFNAHRLVHLAAHLGKGFDVEKLLFKAYFEDGELISDKQVLLRVGKDAGLPFAEVEELLSTSRLSDEVENDLKEAEESDLHIIPYVRFNQTSTLSGSRSEEMYLNTLREAYSDWKSEIR